MPRFQDNANLLSSQDVTEINAEAGRWPFELHVVTTNDQMSLADLERLVAASVDGPNVVAIGINPAIHKTSVKFGVEVGVPLEQMSSMAPAGNEAFKAARYREGIENIANRATASKQQAIVVQREALAAENNAHYFLWATGIIGGIAACCGIYYAIKTWRHGRNLKRLEEERQLQIAEEHSRATRLNDWDSRFGSSRVAAPSVPVQQVTVVNSGGSSSGTDALLAYELGRNSASHHDHTPVPESVRVPAVVSSPEPSYSSSSSSSDWSSSSNSSSSSGYSSNSSWDSGSSSSWDSGGYSGGSSSSDW